MMAHKMANRERESGNVMTIIALKLLYPTKKRLSAGSSTNNAGKILLHRCLILHD